jgi:hypothetical protein
MTDKNLVPEAEVLDAEECWRLLGQTGVGRLAVIMDGHSDVFPINFAVDNQALVFRASSGTKHRAIEADDVVAVEADSVSAEFGMAWSVVVKGKANVDGPAGPALDKIGRALFPWQGVGQEHMIHVTPHSVTGSRFNLTTPMTWRTSLDDSTRAGME